MDLTQLETYTPTKEEFLPIGIKEYAMWMYKEEMDCLNYPTLYVLPLSVEGELELRRLYDEVHIGYYGAYEKNFKYNNETFLAVIVNND